MPNDRRPLEDTLCQTLLECRLDFIERGERTNDEIYDSVSNLYPHLCDNEFICPHYAEKPSYKPEWHHVVRDVLNRLKTETTVIQHIQRGKWYFGEIIDL